MGIRLHRPSHPRRRLRLRRASRLHRQSVRASEARRRSDGAGRRLHRQLAKPVPQRSFRNSAGNPASSAARGRCRNATRQRCHAHRNRHAISQNRFLVCVQHRLAHSSAKTDHRLRHRRHFFSRRRNSEALLSQQFWRTACARRLRTRRVTRTFEARTARRRRSRRAAFRRRSVRRKRARSFSAEASSACRFTNRLAIPSNSIASSARKRISRAQVFSHSTNSTNSATVPTS